MQFSYTLGIELYTEHELPKQVPFFRFSMHFWGVTLEGHSASCGQVAVLSSSIDACRRAGYWEVSYRLPVGSLVGRPGGACLEILFLGS